ncbi:DUF6883 domain-containing protein [Tautonia plasticadhaerens]|uniref:DUF6883 domain-containing protein n=1 Tax=Tautonia plasticadhaerens TaxID=2527974 RepID=A0A518H4J1_9BACT|nr:DUF6883 domain-containing protein [Tautonia plasticadhaerens]QDV35748.1 hypothetical protein ElP_36540 [Tautonia plasticadhaerens]
MKLPNAEDAIVDPEKLRSYCLNPEHIRGKHKARVFASALGLTVEDAEELRQILRSAASDHDAQPGACDEYGRRYTIDSVVERLGKRAIVRSAWIVLTDEDVPRLTTCFVLPQDGGRG